MAERPPGDGPPGEAPPDAAEPDQPKAADPTADPGDAATDAGGDDPGRDQPDDPGPGGSDERGAATDGAPDSPWGDVFEQVEAALDEAGVLGRATRDALLGALGEALGDLGGLSGVRVDIRTRRDSTGVDPDADDDTDDGASDDRRPPDVTVVDGGRGRNQPRSPKPRPELRVAEGKRGAPDADDGSSRPGVRSRVRVYRFTGDADDALFDDSDLDHLGWIQVDADGRQAVYRGDAVRPYRVACTEGRLAVSVDGLTVETLSPGQSLDVEGRAVVVLAADGAAAMGSYVRLSLID